MIKYLEKYYWLAAIFSILMVAMGVIIASRVCSWLGEVNGC